MAGPRLPQAPGGAGNHAAAGIGAHNHVGIPAKLGAALKGNLMAQCFDAGDAEGICQHLGHVGGEKGRQGGAQVDVFHAQVEQGQQDNHRLLLIPGDVIDDGQVIDVVQAEDLLELEGDDSQGVGVVALARVQHPGDAVDIAQLQLIILVLGASGGEDYRVLGQGLGELGVVIAALGPAVAASHDHELADGTALDGFHHLVGQSQHLVVGKAAHQGALFQLNGEGQRLAWAIRAENPCVPGGRPRCGAAGKAHCPGGIEPVLVAVLGGTRQLVVSRMGPRKASNSSFCCHQALP